MSSQAVSLAIYFCRTLVPENELYAAPVTGGKYPISALLHGGHYGVHECLHLLLLVVRFLIWKMVSGEGVHHMHVQYFPRHMCNSIVHPQSEM